MASPQEKFYRRFRREYPDIEAQISDAARDNEYMQFARAGRSPVEALAVWLKQHYPDGKRDHYFKQACGALVGYRCRALGLIKKRYVRVNHYFTYAPMWTDGSAAGGVG